MPSLFKPLTPPYRKNRNRFFFAGTQAEQAPCKLRFKETFCKIFRFGFFDIGKSIVLRNGKKRKADTVFRRLCRTVKPPPVYIAQHK